MDYQKINSGYLVRLYRGERVNESLLEFIKTEGIPGGVLQGIGALTEVTLGYFDTAGKEYLKKQFDDIYEVISFSGNISYTNGEPFIHAHILLGSRQFAAYAGHFFEGTVAVTMEIFITTFSQKIERAMDREFGLNLLKLG